MTNTQAWWRRTDLHLIGIGVVLAAMYIALYTWPFFLPFFDLTLLPRENTANLFFVSVRSGATWPMGVYAGAMTLAFVLYTYAWRTAGRLPEARARFIVIAFAAIFGVICALAAPAMTSDLYDYAMRAKQVLAYGQNPLVATTAGLAADPWYPYIFWHTIPTPYGPIWIAVSLVPYLLTGGGDFIAVLLGLKLLMLAVFLANVLLIDHILGRLSPAHRSSGTLLFAWSPLILLELLVNGHNDGVLVLPLLLCILALVAGRWLFVFPALAVAALVKAPALLLLPVIAIVTVKRVRSRLVPIGTIAASITLAILVIVGMYGLFWSGPETLAHVSRSAVGAIHNSIPVAVAGAARRFGIDPVWPGIIATLVGYAVFFVVTAVVLGRLWRQQSLAPALWLRAGFDTIALFLIVGTAWFFPWYVAWLVALAGLVMHAGRQRVAILFSALSLLYYFAADLQLPVAPYFTGIVVIALVFWIPGALLARELWRERIRSERESASPLMAMAAAEASTVLTHGKCRPDSG